MVAGLGALALAQTTGTSNMDILRQKVKADKKLVVAQNLKLTDAEGATFWPVYDAYQKDLQQINERLAAVVLAYADAYDKGPVVLTDLERDVKELGRRFAVLEAFGNNAERKGPDTDHRFITILPVAQHAGQIRNLGDPATALFAFELDREGHTVMYHSLPGIHQLSLPWSPSPK
jgi:hypothetical protein